MLDSPTLREILKRCRARARLGAQALPSPAPLELEAALLSLADQRDRMAAALEWYSKVTPAVAHGDAYLATYPLLAQRILAGAPHEILEQSADSTELVPAPEAERVWEILGLPQDGSC